MSRTGKLVLISQTNSAKNYNKSNSDIVAGIVIGFAKAVANRLRNRLPLRHSHSPTGKMPAGPAA